MRRTPRVLIPAVALSLAAMVAAQPAMPSSENLVTNSGFEHDAAGSQPAGYALWKVDDKGVCGVDDTVAYTGRKSLRVAGATAASYQYTIPVRPGERYVVGSVCRQKGQGAPELGVYWKSADGKWNWPAGLVKERFRPFAGKWKRAVASVQVPAAGVASLTVLPGVSGQLSTEDVVWFDDVSIRRLDPETGAPVPPKPVTSIRPFAPPPVTPDDYRLNKTQREVIDTLRMCTFTYKKITREEAERRMRKLRDTGYNAILTEGQRYLLVDAAEHPPLSDIQVGSLPFPENVRNTKIVVDAGHTYGLKVYLHLTANSVADYVAEAHPDWMSISLKDGKVKRIWGILFACLNNPEFARLVHGRLETLIRESGADGLMVDETVNMYETCGCPSCRQRFQQDTGLDLPEAGADAAWFGDLGSPLYQTFLTWRLENNMRASRAIRDILLAHRPDGVALTYYALPYLETAMADHGVTIDACDGADAVGWEVGGWYQPNKVRKWPLFIATMKLVRAVSENRTGSIFLIDGCYSYPDFYFTWLLSLSQGAHQYGRRSPDAWAPPVLWEMKHENYLAGLTSASEVAVYISARNHNLIASPRGSITRQNSSLAVCNALTLAHIPYKVIVDKDLRATAPLLQKARTILMMNVGLVSDAEAEALRHFVRDGGTLITSAETSLYDEKGRRRPDFALADVFGCRYLRPVDEGSPLTLKGNHPLLGGLTGEINHADGFLAVHAAETADVLATLQDETGTEVPGLVANPFGKGRAVYFSGHPETGFYLMECNGNTVVPRPADDPPDPAMTSLFVNLVRNVAPAAVSVDNLPQGVVVETYNHQYQGARGLQVHLLNLTGAVSDLLAFDPDQKAFPGIAYPAVGSQLPDPGRPIEITVRGKDIREAFRLSPDYDGLYELPIERRGDEVRCRLPSFARYETIYFNQGETEAVRKLANLPVLTGEPTIKPIEGTEAQASPKRNARGELASASSELAGAEADAAKALDGVYQGDDEQNCWCSADGQDVNAWWMLDLGATKPVDRLKVQYRCIGDSFRFVPVSVTVQASDDGTTWKTLASKSTHVPKAGSPYNDKPYEYAVGTEARFLRLLFEDGGTTFADAKVIELVEVEAVLGK